MPLHWRAACAQQEAQSRAGCRAADTHTGSRQAGDALVHMRGERDSNDSYYLSELSRYKLKLLFPSSSSDELLLLLLLLPPSPLPAPACATPPPGIGTRAAADTAAAGATAATAA